MKTSSPGRWTLGLAVAALILGPALADPDAGAWRRQRHGPGRGEGKMARMAKALGLTEEQRSQIGEIKKSYMDGALGEYRDAMHEARTQLDTAIHDPSATEEQVRAAAEAVSAQAALIAVERHRMALEIDGVLTAEQRQQAAELRQQHLKGRRGPPQLRPETY